MMKSLKSEKDNLKHEVRMMKEVIIDKDKLVDEKETAVKNCEKENNKQEKNLDELNEKNRTLEKEKSDLNALMKIKSDYILQLESKGNNSEDDSEEVEEVHPGTSTVNMNKDTPMCLTCDRGFVTNHDLERHMEDVHSDCDCTLCGKGFPNKGSLISHIKKCAEKRVTVVQCPSCKENFTKGALKKHTNKGKCKESTAIFVCSVCNMYGKSDEDVRKHKREVHEKVDVVSREVCRHYRRGNCRRGESCPFAHVGAQDLIQDKVDTTKVTTKPCRNMNNCVWFQRGKCHFSHELVRVQAPQPTLPPRQPAPQPPKQRQQASDPQGQARDPLGCPKGPTCFQLARGNCVYGGVYYHNLRGPAQQQQQQQMCWYNERCKRNPCPYNHQSLQDFPNLPRPARPQIWQQNSFNGRFHQ